MTNYLTSPMFRGRKKKEKKGGGRERQHEPREGKEKKTFTRKSLVAMCVAFVKPSGENLASLFLLYPVKATAAFLIIAAAPRKFFVAKGKK